MIPDDVPIWLGKNLWANAMLGARGALTPIAIGSSRKMASQTLSISGKTAGGKYGTIANQPTPYAFDIYEYIMSLEKDSDNKVKFNIRYKSVDDDGIELWKDCRDNPIVVQL